jgi:exodeoxyribonuclease-3
VRLQLREMIFDRVYPDFLPRETNVADRLVEGGVDRWTRGRANASDHAPTWIMLDP